MRVLFTIVPAKAHLYPIVPLARALENSGHEVRIASTPDLAGSIVGAGLTAVPVGEEANIASTIDAGMTDARLDRISDALELDPTDVQLWYSIRYMLSVVSMPFPAGNRPPPRPSIVGDLVDFTRAWQPDLVLWDPFQLAAPIAARAAGAAHARFLWGLDMFGWLRDQLSARASQKGGEDGDDPLMELLSPALSHFGVEFDEELMFGQWSVDTMPSGLGFPLGLDHIRMRAVPYHGGAVMPDWLLEPQQHPRICLTLGVSGRDFFGGHESPISDISELVTGLDIEVVATLTKEQISSAAKTSSITENIRTVDYLPLNLLLPTCSAIVHHGGSGTFQSALAHRVPQIVLPDDYEAMLAGQFVADQGAGLVLDQSELSMPKLREHVKRLTEEPGFPQAAVELHRNSLATPGPNDVVHELERRVERNRG